MSTAADTKPHKTPRRLTEAHQVEAVSLFETFESLSASEFRAKMGLGVNLTRNLLDQMVEQGLLVATSSGAAVRYMKTTPNFNVFDVRNDLLEDIEQVMQLATNWTAQQLSRHLALNLQQARATLEYLRSENRIQGHFVGCLCVYALKTRLQVRQATREELSLLQPQRPRATLRPLHDERRTLRPSHSPSPPLQGSSLQDNEEAQPRWRITSLSRLRRIRSSPLSSADLAKMECQTVEHIEQIRAASDDFIERYAAARYQRFPAPRNLQNA